MEEAKISLKGINYGEYDTEKEALELSYEGKRILKIPFKDITQTCVMQRNQTEVNIEINDEEQKRSDDRLCSIRFYVPEDKKNLNVSGQKVITNAQALNEQIIKKSEIGKNAGD